MPSASYVQSSFIGGLVSKWTQGRYHDPHYRSWMDTCLNGFPTETESWTRRPGFGFAGPTKGGGQGILFKFDFEAVAPYTMEFTDSNLRMWQAATPATTNDSVSLTSISAANPAELTLASAVTWSTGDEIFLSGLGTTCPTLQNRRLTITKVDTTHFTITDAITGANVNGSGIGTPSGNTLVNHVLDISTVYASGAWSGLRSVQTEQAAFLLHSQFAPYELVVDTEPVGGNFATFTLEQAFFEDGPYLDPINGVTVTPGATSGITSLTLGFQAYSSTQAYTNGDFVASGGIGYQSLQDANVNNTPSSSPTFWKVVGFGAAINNGQGFGAADIGRLVRLFSEPAAWLAATTYGAGAMVSYNPSGLPGEEVYYSALTGTNLGNTPGTDATHWQLVNIGSTQNPAVWTWGKIIGLASTGAISGSTGTNIGEFAGNGGLSAAFDGAVNKSHSACATAANFQFAFIGKNYGGSPNQISQAVIYPSTDRGFANGTSDSFTISLYGGNSVPSGSFTNGTLLGSVTVSEASLAPVTIQSSNSATSFQYVWIMTALGHVPGDQYIAQLVFYNASAAPGTAVNVEILGPPLIYSATAMPNWRLGLYSNTTGWPNVGTYAEGRLWLASAAFPNRFDACVADGIAGVNNGALPGTVNFAPTDQYGNVTDANAISYTFNAPDVNPILWMIPDVQGVVMGTLAGEWLVQAPTSGGISPLNIVGRRMTVIGCANIEPQRTEHTIIVVQRFLRKIVEFFADVFSGKFSAPNLSKDAKQLTIGNIQQITYQQELCPIIWARVNNGLVGSTYKRDTLMTSAGPTMNGWHQHSLGSGRDIESMIVGSSVNGTLDALMLITNDTNAANTAFGVRFVEVLAPIPDEGTQLSAAPYLDASITPSSFTLNAATTANPYGSITLNGLWYLNGYTVTAWLGGLDCGDYTVSNGSITVPFGDGIGNGMGSFPASSGANRGDQGLFSAAFAGSGVTANGVTMWTGTMPMLVGFTYTSEGRIVRPNTPPESGARSGPAFGKLRRSQWIMAQFEGSQGVSWGVDFEDLLPVSFRQKDEVTPYTVDQQFTGIVRDNLESRDSFDNRLCWQVTRPYICNVQAIGAALETRDL